VFRKILIANRGEIACRIIKSAQQLGIECVAVYSEADKSAVHVELADQAYCIGPPAASQSYLCIDKIIVAARISGAQAIHPGYGFLSENHQFVSACDDAGLVFIGPSVDAIRAMGLKDAAKILMEETGVPVVPGYHGENQDPEFLKSKAELIGYPVLIKARAGGGGKGMRLVESTDNFELALTSAQREARSSFADDHVIIEKFISSPRHIEVQIFADNKGSTVHLFERDCSMQRRHQKIIEEAPAPGMTEDLRLIMGEAAVRAAKAVNYVGAGTVEFIVDSSDGLEADGFYFMEMNTRLQVEHPVTEAITGLDLVEWQLRVAAGEELPKSQDELSIQGHAIEARIYAEDTENGFLPATGKLDYLCLPDNQLRVDSGVRQSDEITPFYDPMIAKVISHGQSRDLALAQLQKGLSQTHIAGCLTNVNFLCKLLSNAEFINAQLDTGLIDRNSNSLTTQQEPDERLIAIATLSALGYLSVKSSSDPWKCLTGWRHFSVARQFVHLSYGKTDLEIVLTAHTDQLLKLHINGSTISARIENVNGNKVCVDFDGELIKAVVINQTDTVTVFSSSNSFKFQLPDTESQFDYADQSEGNILAPMPGLITAVNVSKHSSVNEGDVLIVMEAMKMEHSLHATATGKVDQLNVATSDQVKEGELLLSLVEETSND